MFRRFVPISRMPFARVRAILSSTTDNTFPATQFTVSNQSKLLCTATERAARSRMRAAYKCPTVAPNYVRLWHPWHTLAHTLTRTRNAPLPWHALLYSTPRGRSPFAVIASTAWGDHAFFRNFRIFCSVETNCRDIRGLSVCTRVYDRIALRCHDSHSPSFNPHPLHSNAREWKVVMNSRNWILSPVLDTTINSVL